MTAATGPSQARNHAGFVLVTLIWGSTWLVIKDQIGTVPAAWSVTWRFTLAGLCMAAFAALRRAPLRLSAEGLRLAALMGLLQFCANFQFVYQAEHRITSGLVAVLFALLLVPNALLARIFLGTKVSGRFLLGSAIALGGIALLIIHEYRAAPLGDAVLLGFALTGCAILCASLSNVIQAGSVAQSQPLLPLLATAMLLGAAFNAAYAWATVGPPVLDTSPRFLAGVAYLGIVGTVLTFPIYFALIRDWGPGKAAYNGVAVPVVAMGLSTLFEGYRWTALAAGGAVLAMTGLLIALSGRK